MTVAPPVPDVDVEELRCEIQKEYASVAENPDKGFHFHTGRKLAGILGYAPSLLEGIPEAAIESFAGTGNPFSLGELAEGEKVVDLGSGAGIDSLIAGKLVGPTGQVLGVDMTPEMVGKARLAAAVAGLGHVEFREGFIESLPIEDGWADVVISNGVVNLAPDKVGLFREMNRVLRPGGRLQIGDIMVQKAVPDGAKQNIDLWKG
jgi:arsenite methyltransferase